jgi:hypothetical protein
MARFVNQYYDGQPLVMNDLGAIAWYTKAQPVDMAGLATVEITWAWVRGYFGNKFLDKLARERGAKIAIIYTSWLPERNGPDGPHVPPDGWIKVGTWGIKHNVICGDDIVDFYALDDEAADTLAAHLREFAPKLPADVDQYGWFNGKVKSKS